MDERLQQFETKMEKTCEYLEADFMTIRAGRANPHVLDKIRVDYYGSPTPLQQVGNVTVPEPRMIQIAPWEKSLIKAIEKAIMASDIGITPSNDGNVIRLVFPEVTEEQLKISREYLIKIKYFYFLFTLRNQRLFLCLISLNDIIKTKLCIKGIAPAAPETDIK